MFILKFQVYNTEGVSLSLPECKNCNLTSLLQYEAGTCQFSKLHIHAQCLFQDFASASEGANKHPMPKFWEEWGYKSWGGGGNCISKVGSGYYWGWGEGGDQKHP